MVVRNGYAVAHPDQPAQEAIIRSRVVAPSDKRVLWSFEVSHPFRKRRGKGRLTGCLVRSAPTSGPGILLQQVAIECFPFVQHGFQAELRNNQISCPLTRCPALL